MSRCLDPPDAESVVNASTHLFEVGALDSNEDDATPTELGEIMACLPTEPSVSLLMVFGLAFGCLEESIVMAAYVSGNFTGNQLTRSDGD